MKLPKLSPLKRFGLQFLALYFAMAAILPLMGFQATYEKGIHGIGNVIFKKFGARGHVTFTKGKYLESYELNSEIQLRNRRDYAAFLARQRGPTRYGRIFFNPWWLGFLPAAMLMALILATPIPRKRKLKTLLLALFIFHVIFFLRLGINIFHTFNRCEWLGVIDLSEGMTNFVWGLKKLVMENIVVNFMIPPVIWLLVTFRKGDMDLLKSRASVEVADPVS